MKRLNHEQPIDKKPVVANKELWRKLTESSQASVSGGLVSVPGSDSVLT